MPSQSANTHSTSARSLIYMQRASRMPFELFKSFTATWDTLQPRPWSTCCIPVVPQPMCSPWLRIISAVHAFATRNPTSRHFNQSTQADVFWIRTEKKKWPILAILDSATKYLVACQVHSEQTSDYIAALERHWIAHFGTPEELVTDEGRGWLSNEFLPHLDR